MILYVAQHSLSSLNEPLHRPLVSHSTYYVMGEPELGVAAQCTDWNLTVNACIPQGTTAEEFWHVCLYTDSGE